MLKLNSFELLWTKNRILSNKRLKDCLILLILVTAALTAALIFSDSMMKGITDKYIYLSSGHILVSQTQAEELNLDSDYYYSADTVCTGYALLYSPYGTTNVSVKGVGEMYFNNLRAKQINFETTAEPGNLQSVIISETSARKLNVSLGDKIALMIVPDSKEGVLRPAMVYVSGIFTTGYETLDQMICYTNLEYSKLLFTSKESLSTEIILKEKYENDAARISNIIYQDNRKETQTWNSLNFDIYQNFVTSKQMIFIILVVVSIIASFYVSSISQQMLSDDMKNISLLKLIGSSNHSVRRAEFLSIYTVCLSGILSGCILGLLISCLLSPVLKLISRISISSLSYYLLDFDITVPILSILLLVLILAFIIFLNVTMVLKKTKNISPIQLFTEQ